MSLRWNKIMGKPVKGFVDAAATLSSCKSCVGCCTLVDLLIVLHVCCTLSQYVFTTVYAQSSLHADWAKTRYQDNNLLVVSSTRENVFFLVPVRA